MPGMHAQHPPCSPLLQARQLLPLPLEKLCSKKCKMIPFEKHHLLAEKKKSLDKGEKQTLPHQC